MTLSINDTQHNWTFSTTMLCIKLSVIKLNVAFIYCYAESHYTERGDAECRYAECLYAECRGAILPTHKVE
jgi:hypothetical protein